LYRSIRDYINKLKKDYDCEVIDFSSTKLRLTDLSALLYYIDTECSRAVLIHSISGAYTQVAGNIYGSIKRLCASVGINPSKAEIQELGRNAEGSPGGMGGFGSNAAYALDEVDRAGVIMLKRKLIESVKISRSVNILHEAPCTENFLGGSKAKLTEFCVPIQYCSGDGGAFLTSGVIVTRSPISGIMNYAIRRHQICNDQELRALIAPGSDTAKHVKEAAALGQKLEAAIAVGVSPAVMFAACMFVPEHIGETSAAGNIQGQSLDVVACKTIDLHVPACAEFVLEGYIDPCELKDEGPMVEYSGCSTGIRKTNVFHLTGIMYRNDPIYPTLRSGRSSEHEMMQMICYWSKAHMLRDRLNRVFSGVVSEVAFGAGSCASQIIIQVKNVGKRDGDHILEWILNQSLTKVAIIVDESVCPFNQEEVAWATFLFAGSPGDFLKFNSISTTPVDPTSRFCRETGHHHVCKVGINAIPAQKFTKQVPPGWSKIKKQEFEQLISGICR